jgi:hypothetical protein
MSGMKRTSLRPFLAGQQPSILTARGLIAAGRSSTVADSGRSRKLPLNPMEADFEVAETARQPQCQLDPASTLRMPLSPRPRTRPRNVWVKPRREAASA